jgi:hypothetical protein
MTESILRLESGIGIVTLVSLILSIVLMTAYIIKFVKTLYRFNKREKSPFLLALVFIQLLCVLNAIISIVRCFSVPSLPISGLAYIISLSMISFWFVYLVSEKFQLLAHMGIITQNFKLTYFGILFVVYFGSFFWKPFQYAAMFNGYTGPIADFSTRFGSPFAIIWWFYVLGIDFVANYFLIRGMTEIASKKQTNTKPTMKVFIKDLVSSLGKLRDVSDVKSKGSYERKKRYEYLLSVRYCLFCVIIDMGFLASYAVGSFGNFTVNPSKAEILLAMTHLGSIGIYVHTMTASMFFLHLKAMFEELSRSKDTALTTILFSDIKSGVQKETSELG